VSPDFWNWIQLGYDQRLSSDGKCPRYGAGTNLSAVAFGGAFVYDRIQEKEEKKDETEEFAKLLGLPPPVGKALLETLRGAFKKSIERNRQRQVVAASQNRPLPSNPT
jgi:hypothetical protein